ncbi:hypothetical protein L4D06_20130 [Enterovibrio makurazakiensis]|uniref:EF-hand domain-containing protein n=1 Tax=Enterovibrio gelatinilyticus TaxID=2899819 RepID=A0ABT5R3E6_9GAMM|nr:hypothetical protein [Enterovibrio sp. ZSDZ42]MDD1794685.1 hypothetical protein [Enterovibrio sp. ZSDZ42]
MPITTDTPQMRETLSRLNQDAIASIDSDGDCKIKVSDLSTLLTAYKIELNKNRSLKRTIAKNAQNAA